MKVTAEAGKLANALSLAILIASNKKPAPPAHGVVRIKAADDDVSFSCADYTGTILATTAATVNEPGDIAIAAERLETLLTGFAPSTMVDVTTDNTGMRINAGNGRYRLPAFPLEELPPVVAIDHETGSVEISGDDCLKLTEPLIAASTEPTRYAMCGVYWHSVGDKLVAASTDGTRLIRVAVPAATFSTSQDLVVSPKSAELFRRLIKRTKSKRIMLRRSRGLLACSGDGFQYITRLIDGKFPAYEAVIPKPSSDAVDCDREQLRAVLSRLAGTATAQPPLLALSWNSGEPLLKLFLARQPKDGTDSIEAKTTGSARFAAPFEQLAEMIDGLGGKHVHLEAAGPLVIRGDGDKLVMIMPSHWNFGDTDRKEATKNAA